jgi:aspartyl-tRNA(Asn)/glutamyl-tRNA(Gln) amidotransferase subunit C
MSQITPADIKKIARLARIEIAPNDSEALTKQLGSIISWVEQLNEVNTDNVSALTSVCNMNLRLNEDKIADGNIAPDILQNAKNPIYGYFSVPKVIE